MPATKSANSIVYTKAVRALRAHANPERAKVYRWYFKDPGRDRFLGVSTKAMREVARQIGDISMADLRRLMRSRVHEERSLAHTLLRRKFDKGSATDREKLFNFYLKYRRSIHSWDGVDDSAPYIVGPHLLRRDKTVLYELARSRSLWDRRIAIVSTLAFIRDGNLSDTLRITEMLLDDQEDLVQKACGWMLREVGKRDERLLKRFLKKHCKTMPRTMLRYAIERFPEKQRQSYLKGQV